MTQPNERLERRYRRLLRLYPRRFRDAREREMLTVLMDGAESGQTRPRRGEAFNLVAHALGLRVRQSDWELQHPLTTVVIRGLVAVWLTVATVLLCSNGQWWGLVLLVFAALHLYLADRVASRAFRGGS